jgi:hypothetical protein
MVFLLNAIKHPTPGHASETMSHLITAILVAGLTSSMITTPFLRNLLNKKSRRNYPLKKDILV